MTQQRTNKRHAQRSKLAANFARRCRRNLLIEVVRSMDAGEGDFDVKAFVEHDASWEGYSANHDLHYPTAPKLEEHEVAQVRKATIDYYYSVHTILH